MKRLLFCALLLCGCGDDGPPQRAVIVESGAVGGWGSPDWITAVRLPSGHIARICQAMGAVGDTVTVYWDAVQRKYRLEQRR